MARRLSLVLSREQVRTVRDAAILHASEATEPVVKQRWETVIREANKALNFAERTGSPNSAK